MCVVLSTLLFSLVASGFFGLLRPELNVLRVLLSMLFFFSRPAVPCLLVVTSLPTV